MKVKLVVFLVSLALLSGCGKQESPVSAEIINSGSWNILKITSVADAATVTNASLNRGVCQLYQPVEPVNLKFGQSAHILVPAGCDLKEAEVMTDKGSFTFAWN